MHFLDAKMWLVRNSGCYWFDSVIHPLSMSNEPVSPIPEEYFRFRNHSEMLDYFDNKLTLPSRITGKVTGIMMDIRWCYFSCSRCTKKLQRTISGFTCLTCNNSNDVGVLQYYVIWIQMHFMSAHTEKRLAHTEIRLTLINFFWLLYIVYTIADETAEGLFVGFDREMTK